MATHGMIDLETLSTKPDATVLTVGAIKFDPRSDKWLRICMFQGAPLPNQLNNFDDKWVYETLN